MKHTVIGSQGNFEMQLQQVCFGLCWVFIAGLPLSLAAGAVASEPWCSGFSLCRPLWSRSTGFSSCGSRALSVWARPLWGTGWVAPWRVRSPHTRSPHHTVGSSWTTREAPVTGIFKVHITGQSRFPMGLPKRIRVIWAGDIVKVLFILIIPLSTYINAWHPAILPTLPSDVLKSAHINSPRAGC